MTTTKIEWTHHTLNFWWGCTKISEACAHCYAEGVATRFGEKHFGKPVVWGAGGQRQERLATARKEALALNAKAAKTGKRTLVFVNSMSDWLDDEVPIEWLAHLLETLRLCPALTFQLLTKRPENWESRMMWALQCFDDADPTFQWLGQWIAGLPLRQPPSAPIPPSNVWIGITAETQNRLCQRGPHLVKIPAEIRFLSCEPLLGPLGFNCREDREGEPPTFSKVFDQGIHWVIAGGESGTKARPTNPIWFRRLRDQCATAGVPFFFKQWGSWAPHRGITTATDTAVMERRSTADNGKHLDGQLHQAFPLS